MDGEPVLYLERGGKRLLTFPAVADPDKALRSSAAPTSARTTEAAAWRCAEASSSRGLPALALSDSVLREYGPT